jgi:hypothetical protein
MPYDIAKDFDGCAYAVVKLTTSGKELAPGGCHQTPIEAGKHLAALEAATDYSRELRVLPDNFRPALAQDVPEGRACGNCSFYNEEKIQGDKAWCEKWDAYVSGAYYCNAWQPHGDGEAHDEPYDEMDNDADRATSFNYELRHPGHGDQSSHNPHKGGAYAIGSGKSATSEQAADRIKANMKAFEQGGGTIKLDPSEQEMLDARDQISEMDNKLKITLLEKNNMHAQGKGPAITDIERQSAEGMAYASTAIGLKISGDRFEDDAVGRLAIAYTKGPEGQSVVAGAILFSPPAPWKVANDTNVVYLGSTGIAKGAGSTLMFTAMNDAVNKQATFRVKEPVLLAVPFYRSLGLDTQLNSGAGSMVFNKSTKVDEIVNLVNTP